MATQGLTSEDAVVRYLQPKLRIIVETILEKITKENEELINEIVYGAGTPEKYHRTGQFADLAWAHDITKDTTYEINGEFKYNPDGMYDTHPSQAPYQRKDPGEDERGYLAEIIYNGVAGHIFGTGFWTEKRDAWTALVKVVGSNTMRSWIKEGANKAQLKISWD